MAVDGKSLAGKRVLLIIGGGIAAYKSLSAIRRLRDLGADVRVILTKAAQKFVTPLTASTLSENPAHTDLFDLTQENEIGHIRLARDCDMIVVAPATADLMSRMAHGMANDLATSVLLASDKPVLLAPAMNPAMWTHAATRRNLETLLADGITSHGPETGDMAERGEAGVGRMSEPEDIVAEIVSRLSVHNEGLSGKHVLITAGPTHEPIDPVRYIANRSSGRQGYAIAEAARQAGARVTLISGPVNIVPPSDVTCVQVETARQMLDATETALPADIAIMASAVADWRVETRSSGKIKKTANVGPPAFTLRETTDILASISKRSSGRPGLVVGFAAETDSVVDHATAKRLRKGCDWIVANDVSPETGIMGGTHNSVHLVTDQGVESWPDLPKQAVATRLIERIISETGNCK